MRLDGLPRLGPQEEKGLTAAAWVMMLLTWSVILFFTVKFFLMVLRTPPRDE